MFGTSSRVFQQCIAVLCAWMLLFPLNCPRWGGTGGIALARSGDAMSSQSLLELHQQAWSVLFTSPVDDANSALWLDAPYQIESTWASGSTSGGEPFHVALTSSRARGTLPGVGWLDAAAAILVTARGQFPAWVMLVTVPDLSGQPRTRVAVLEAIDPNDPVFCVDDPFACAGFSSESPAASAALREAWVEAVSDYSACARGCRQVELIEADQAWALYQTRINEAEAARQRDVQAAQAAHRQAIEDAKASYNASMQSAAARLAVCLTLTITCGGLWWLCSTGCLALAGLDLRDASRQYASAVSAAWTAFSAATAAADQRHHDACEAARRDRDRELDAARKRRDCCIARCEGVECPPTSVFQVPVTQ